MGYKVAIVGATGLVGAQFLNILEERNFPVDELSLLASDRSAGKKLTFRGDSLEVRETTESSFAGIDIALFSAGGDISKYYSPLAVSYTHLTLPTKA